MAFIQTHRMKYAFMSVVQITYAVTREKPAMRLF